MKEKVEAARARLPGSVLDLIGSVPITYTGERYPGDRVILGRFQRYPDRITIYAGPWWMFGLHVTPTVIHELGHAVNYATGKQSDSDPFLVARAHDWANLRPYEKRGPTSETFADTCVALWGPWWARWYLGPRPALKKFVRGLLGL